MHRRTFLARSSAIGITAWTSGALGAPTGTADAAGREQTRTIAARADALLALLDDGQRLKAQFPFLREPVATAARFKGGLRGDVDMVGERYGAAVWSNFPVSDVPRPGLRMGALDDGQRAAVHSLCKRS